MNAWTAIRQKRDGGDCSVTRYAPQNPRGGGAKTGRFYFPALRLIHVFQGGELVGKFVSLYGGIDGANDLLDDVLGKVVTPPADTKPAASKSIWNIEDRPLRTGTAAWPFQAA